MKVLPKKANKPLRLTDSQVLEQLYNIEERLSLFYEVEVIEQTRLLETGAKMGLTKEDVLVAMKQLKDEQLLMEQAISQAIQEYELNLRNN